VISVGARRKRRRPALFLGSPRGKLSPMCTILALCRARGDYPLVLATNRDEFYARPSAGPAQILESPRSVGGRDLRAHGTWMGVTEHGLFVGVTNQRTLRAPDATKRSRGELVMQALALREPEAIRRFLGSLDGAAYNPFNLMFGDARVLYVAYGREAPSIEVEEVPDGVHLLPNDRLDSPQFWKVERAKELIEPHVGEAWPLLSARLEACLADGALPPLELLPELPPGAPFDKPTLQRLAALCVRTPGYGTRSSTVVALAPGRVAHFAYADGPPDQTAFVDVLPLYEPLSPGEGRS
jgi:uncharacterized protein with NRDE domain